MMKRIVLSILLIIGIAGAVQISSNYAGNGSFLVCDEINDNQVRASGDGEVEMGIDVTQNATWSGIQFSGYDGKFATVGKAGPIHVMSIRNATIISAETLTQTDKSLFELDGFGLFRQSIFDLPNKGRRDKVFDLEFEGNISMNTTVFDDTEKEQLTTDITAGDM